MWPLRLYLDAIVFSSPIQKCKFCIFLDAIIHCSEDMKKAYVLRYISMIDKRTYSFCKLREPLKGGRAALNCMALFHILAGGSDSHLELE